MVMIGVLSSQLTTSTPTGAPTGVANDPKGGFNSCTDCHNGTAVTSTGNITTNIPAAGYTPGATYTITATVTSVGKTVFGFEISPQNASGTKLGTLMAGTGTKLINSGNYITQSSPKSGTGTATWTFTWVAPATGSGNVTFYGSLLGCNNNGGTSGDITYITSTTVSESVPCTATASITALQDTVCNGSLTTLTANGVGTYLWSNGSTSSNINVGPGVYTLTITKSVGCSATATKTIYNNSVTAGITSSVDTICPQDSVLLTAVGGSSYLWSNGSTSQSIYVKGGVYTVTVTNMGCSSTASKNIYARTKVAPNGLVASNVFGVSAKISWNKPTCATGYKLQYRPVGTTVFKTVTLGDTSSKNLTGLLPSTAYEYQMAALYGSATNISSFGTLKNFTTLCNCVKPTVTANVLTNKSIQFTWVDDSCSVKHKVRYRVVGATTWVTKTTVDSLVSSVTVTNLVPNTAYEYQSRTDCNASGTFNSGWGTSVNFSTPLRLGNELITDINIYPNPSADNIYVECPTDGILTIYDVLGSQISSVKVQSQSIQTISDLAPGFYVVRFIDNETGVMFNNKVEILK